MIKIICDCCKSTIHNQKYMIQYSYKIKHHYPSEKLIEVCEKCAEKIKNYIKSLDNEL